MSATIARRSTRRTGRGARCRGGITDHLDAVLANVTAYRAHLPARPASWDVLYRALLDQLAQGAVFVLRHPGARLPAHLSVGYKVAAGYQVPVRELLELELLGRAPPPTVEHLLAYVRGRASLVGKREVCAAPMVMVARVTAAMLEGGAAPVAFSPGVFPRPRALRWFEVISGYRVRAPDDAPTALTLRSQLHTIAVPA